MRTHWAEWCVGCFADVNGDDVDCRHTGKDNIIIHAQRTKVFWRSPSSHFPVHVKNPFYDTKRQYVPFALELYSRFEYDTLNKAIK